MKLLSLILFLIALGVLVTIHEFGHFIAAKSFNVYCSDFSIGFGYKILKIGRKKPDEKKSSLFFIENKNPKSETTFSLGIVPLGGYVGMLGEDDDDVLKDNPELKGRSVEDINFWKKLIVFFAGIFMNFILAWIIFFISASCFEQKSINALNEMGYVNEETYMSQKVLTTDYEGQEPLVFNDPETVDGSTSSYVINVNKKSKLSEDSNYYSINDPSVPVKISSKPDYYYSIIFNSSNVGYNDLDFSQTMKVVVASKEGDKYFPKITNNNYEYYTFEKGDTIEPIKIYISKMVDGDLKNDDLTTAYLHLTIDDNLAIEHLGVGTYINSDWNGWNSFNVASKQWWNSTKLIGETLGKLFYDSDTWGQVGGPVAIFTQTTSILSNYPFYFYLNSWGMISVNLALFNLLPFPGLDGWQILVNIIEGSVNLFKKKKNKNKSGMNANDKSIDATKEVNVGDKVVNVDKPWKFPAKAKNIISYIGLGLLFLLAAVIFVKDVIGLF